MERQVTGKPDRPTKQTLRCIAMALVVSLVLTVVPPTGGRRTGAEDVGCI